MLKNDATPTNQEIRRLNYVALGDSLTEGVGDDTHKGGFVPIVADLLQDKYQLTSIEFDNFGKAGDRSDQILKRLRKNKKMQKTLSSANIITLTCGGNDLLKVIREHIFSLKERTFVKPQKQYQKQLTQLIQEIRKYNPKAPIYLLGIYNPFYLNFPEFTQMQEIVTNWNDASQQTVATFKKVYF
ncbi:SGNH/GDSL hydrolase family protein, partial [Enterococcus cecorum]|nr:SGNH/GDSL hydrolase family protein [Enterococcus cecorum]